MVDCKSKGRVRNKIDYGYLGISRWSEGRLF